MLCVSQKTNKTVAEAACKNLKLQLPPSCALRPLWSSFLQVAERLHELHNPDAPGLTSLSASMQKFKSLLDKHDQSISPEKMAAMQLRTTEFSNFYEDAMARMQHALQRQMAKKTEDARRAGLECVRALKQIPNPETDEKAYRATLGGKVAVFASGAASCRQAAEGLQEFKEVWHVCSAREIGERLVAEARALAAVLAAHVSFFAALTLLRSPEAGARSPEGRATGKKMDALVQSFYCRDLPNTPQIANLPHAYVVQVLRDAASAIERSTGNGKCAADLKGGEKDCLEKRSRLSEVTLQESESWLRDFNNEEGGPETAAEKGPGEACPPQDTLDKGHAGRAAKQPLGDVQQLQKGDGDKEQVKLASLQKEEQPQQVPAATPAAASPNLGTEAEVAVTERSLSGGLPEAGPGDHAAKQGCSADAGGKEPSAKRPKTEQQQELLAVLNAPAAKLADQPAGAMICSATPSAPKPAAAASVLHYLDSCYEDSHRRSPRKPKGWEDDDSVGDASPRPRAGKEVGKEAGFCKKQESKAEPALGTAAVALEKAQAEAEPALGTAAVALEKAQAETEPAVGTAAVDLEKAQAVAKSSAEEGSAATDAAASCGRSGGSLDNKDKKGKKEKKEKKEKKDKKPKKEKNKDKKDKRKNAKSPRKPEQARTPSLPSARRMLQPHRWTLTR